MSYPSNGDSDFFLLNMPPFFGSLAILTPEANNLVTISKQWAGLGENQEICDSISGIWHLQKWLEYPTKIAIDTCSWLLDTGVYKHLSKMHLFRDTLLQGVNVLVQLWTTCPN